VGNLKRFNAKRKLRAEIVAIKMDNRMQKFLLGLRVEAIMIDMLRNSASDAPNISLAAPLKSFGSSVHPAGLDPILQVKRLSAVMSDSSVDKTALDKVASSAAHVVLDVD
jgi:hypothetical protein